MKALPETNPPTSNNGTQGWTFLTNHCHVLVCLNQDPTIRIRDIASAVGITHRAVQKIMLDLYEAGAVSKLRDGRRNAYRLNYQFPLRHPLHSNCTIGDILKDLGQQPLEPEEVKRLIRGELKAKDPEDAENVQETED